MRNQVYASLLVLMLHSAALSQTTEQNPLLIKGQVLDDQARPVAGAVLFAHPDGGLRGKLPSATSDARGEFTLEVSKTGSFRVTASKPNDGYPSSSNPFYYPLEDPLTHVFVEAKEPTSFTTVRLGPQAGKLAGRIVDAETGRRLEERVQIGLCRAEVPKYCHRLSAQSLNGEFNVLVPSAPFTIQISASGYQDWSGAEGADRQPVTLQVASGTTKVLSVKMERLLAHDDIVNSSVLAAPQTLLPVAGAELDHYPRTTRLEWSAVPEAASYTVELEVCEAGRGVDGKECEGGGLLQLRGNPPLSGIEGTSYEFLFIGAQPGRWRVWAVDVKGRAGAKSAWSKFIYKR